MRLFEWTLIGAAAIGILFLIDWALSKAYDEQYVRRQPRRDPVGKRCQ